MTTKTDFAPPLRMLPLPRHWWVWTIAGVLLAVALGIFVTSDPQFATVDYTLNRWFDEHRLPVVDWIAIAIARIFSPLGAIIILVATLLLTRRRDRTMRTGSAFVFVVAVAWGGNQILKLIFQRPRPDLSVLTDPIVSIPLSYSYPSGHASISAALAIGLWLLAWRTRWQRAATIGLPFLFVVVALSRIYLGVHYPTDVIGALFITSAGALLAMWIWNTWIASKFRDEDDSASTDGLA